MRHKMPSKMYENGFSFSTIRQLVISWNVSELDYCLWFRKPHLLLSFAENRDQKKTFLQAQHNSLCVALLWLQKFCCVDDVVVSLFRPIECQFTWKFIKLPSYFHALLRRLLLLVVQPFGNEEDIFTSIFKLKQHFTASFYIASCSIPLPACIHPFTSLFSLIVVARSPFVCSTRRRLIPPSK